MPDRYAACLGLEQAADRIRGHQNSCVPGLLQTEDYARALLRATHPGASAEATERRVALRMRRQRLLAGAELPPVWVVLDETVLPRTVGGPGVMRAQIDHLVEIGRLPQVTVRLMPFAHGPHPAMPAAAYHLFRFRARELPDIVYVDGLLGAVHLDKPEHVEPYREALNRLATQAPPATRTASLLGAIRAELQG